MASLSLSARRPCGTGRRPPALSPARLLLALAALAVFAAPARALARPPQSRDCAALEEFFAKGGITPRRLWGRGEECCGFRAAFAGEGGAAEGRVDCRDGRVVEISWADPPPELLLSGNLASMPLTSLTRLEKLDLSFNRLSGRFPAWISHHSSVIHLNVAGNRLSGALPQLPRTLESLDASRNALSGSLPDLDETRLVKADLASNRLSGAVPPLPRSLRHLDLTKNRLAGPLPPLPPLSTCAVDATVCSLTRSPACGVRRCGGVSYQSSGRAVMELEPVDMADPTSADAFDEDEYFEPAVPARTDPRPPPRRRPVLESFQLDDEDEGVPAPPPTRPHRLSARQTSPVPPPTSSALSTGAIVGIAIGGAVGLLAIAGLLWYFLRPKPAEKAVQMVPVTAQGASSTVQQTRPASTAAVQQQPAAYVPPAQLAAASSAYPSTAYPESVPFNTIAPPIAAGAAVAAGTGAALAPTPSARRRGAPASPESPTMEGRDYVAVRPYAPQLNDEMVLNKGDVVTVLKVFDDGWAMGRNAVSKVEGLVPLACLMAAS
ncbi:hypothetical protein DFJ74DRAFT_774458 [Hyaloraphidium curvatum]|nr:hypothetical protein DFJ74DRAFT_774458 [Hyaloraphidium curvatum]